MGRCVKGRKRLLVGDNNQRPNRKVSEIYIYMFVSYTKGRR